MFRYTFLDFVRGLALVAAAACTDAIAPKPAPVDVYAAASMEDVAAVVRAAEAAERRACAFYTIDLRDTCAVR